MRRNVRSSTPAIRRRHWLTPAVALTSTALLIALSAPAWATHACFGISSSHGGTGADVRSLSNGDDSFHALAGNDQINGLSGIDRLCADEGDDTLHGNLG